MTTTLPLGEKTAVEPVDGRVIGGRYRLLTRLGEGGMGQVWRARRDDTGVEVAVKILRPEMCGNPEAVARFEREARAAARLSHPGCVAVHDFGRDGQALYLIMELVAGEPLGARVAAVGGRLPVFEAARVIDGMLAALEHAHGLGVVHRDLKPENVMLAPGPDGGELVKLLDFGVARVLLAGTESSSERPATAAGVVMGTPQYLSPEQALGEPGDVRSDVYAVAVLFYELLTGVQPFAAPTHREVLSAHIARTPPPPSQVDGVEALAAFDALIMRGLAKAPSERFTSAGEMRAVLGQVCARVGMVLPEVPGSLPAGAWTSPGWASPTAGGEGGRTIWEAVIDRWRTWPARRQVAASAVAGVLVIAMASTLVVRCAAESSDVAARGQGEPMGMVEVREALARGDLRGARRAGEDLIVQYPDDARAFVWLGHALFASRDKARGLAAYREAVRLAPKSNDPEMVANLRATFADRAVGDEAFELAVQVGPPAVAALEDVLGDSKDAKVRARARAAMTQIIRAVADEVIAVTSGRSGVGAGAEAPTVGGAAAREAAAGAVRQAVGEAAK